MSAKRTKISVIGGGIIGMTSAVVLIENIPNIIDITLISEEFTPNTTGDGSVGLIYPYLPGKTDPKRVRRWVRDTMSYLRDHFVSPNAGKLGIGLMSLYLLFDEKVDAYKKSECDEEMISCRDMTPQEMNLFPKKWTKGVTVTTYYAECTKLLPFLMQQFKSKGGRVVQKRINDIKELCGKYDIAINCTGIVANKFCGDNKVHPIRGQIYRIYAPWIKHGVMAGAHYILPNSDTVVLGGTKQAHNWSREVDLKDSEHIMEGCAQLVPSVKTAQVVKEWVGLRPGRESVRLETEVINNLGNKLHVVHNYGHGGSGVTLSYGCALEVLQNVNQILAANIQSKL